MRIRRAVGDFAYDRRTSFNAFDVTASSPSRLAVLSRGVRARCASAVLRVAPRVNKSLIANASHAGDESSLEPPMTNGSGRCLTLCVVFFFFFFSIRFNKMHQTMKYIIIYGSPSNVIASSNSVEKQRANDAPQVRNIALYDSVSDG